MNPENDHDLRQRFVALRKANREVLPTWKPKHLMQPPLSAPRFRLPRWSIITSASAACLLLGFAMIHRKEQSDLTKALPVLFETPTEPLFTSLEDFSDPSDFLLPTHLSIYLP
jgi:hypothetical protein